MKVRAGTSGYSYKEWKGTFYPKDISADDMLSFYAKHFATVEINNTFYKMPSKSLLTGWAEQVPEGFSFVLKAPRRITHIKKLKGVDDDVAYLLKQAAELGAKRGPLLFQVPPFLKKDLGLLRDFLRLLSPEEQTALEFRHQSWFDDEVFTLLRTQNVALCLADADSELEIPFVSTADWGYLRLRRAEYTDEDLQQWVERIAGESWKEAFVFFKHEESGTGPQFARRFLKLVEKR